MNSALKLIGAALLIFSLAVLCARAQQPAIATQADPGYVLGSNDQIVIRALDAPEISDKPILIGTNGNITLPLVGRITAAGLTVPAYRKAQEWCGNCPSKPVQRRSRPMRRGGDTDQWSAWQRVNRQEFNA